MAQYPAAKLIQYILAVYRNGITGKLKQQMHRVVQQDVFSEKQEAGYHYLITQQKPNTAALYPFSQIEMTGLSDSCRPADAGGEHHIKSQLRLRESFAGT